MVDPTGTYSFTFDNLGRLTGTTTQYTFLARSFTTSYTYDARVVKKFERLEIA